MTTDRRLPARHRDDRLRHVLEEMFANGERISARGALRHMPDLRAPSSLTRDPVRRRLLEEYRRRQAERDSWAERAKRQSALRLEKALADRDHQIAELEHKVQLLLASHRAMVEAVGELGGLQKWKQAFHGYERCLAELDQLNAISTAAERAAGQARESSAMGPTGNTSSGARPRKGQRRSARSLHARP